MLVAGATAALAAGLFAPVLLINIDEMAVPPASELPDGLAVESEELGCGSGGCWRDFRVRPPEGQSAEELAAELGLGRDSCAARSLLDRRRVCTGGNVLGDQVRVYLLYERSLNS